MAEETKVVEQPHSCKIAINAKGQWSGEVKVYDSTSEGAVTEAVMRAERLEVIIHGKNKAAQA